MDGGIYTEEKCPRCGLTMLDNSRNAVWCPAHREERAKTFMVRFGRKIFKRFSDQRNGTGYQAACLFLNGVRFKKDEGTYDPRDYQKTNPLGFAHLATKYLEIKRQTLEPASYRAIVSHIRRAEKVLGEMSVKDIGYDEPEDFFLSQKDVSSKTVQNIKITIHNFFQWLVRRRIIRQEQTPEFPEWRYELGFRRTLKKSVQESVLAEVHRMEWGTNPRAYMALRWLSTYISLRPGDLTVILEEHVALSRGLVTVPTHKTSKSTHKIKIIPLLSEDVAMAETLQTGFPKMSFFRWDTGGNGKRAGDPYGRNYLYKLWMRACKNPDVTGVDLYGGTRHTTMQYLRKKPSPEGVKRLSLHTTNKALDRYLEISFDELREGYALANSQSEHRYTTATPIGGAQKR